MDSDQEFYFYEEIGLPERKSEPPITGTDADDSALPPALSSDQVAELAQDTLEDQHLP